MKKIYSYVDGYNLYHGMMDKNNSIPDDKSEFPLRKYLWLNLYSFILSYFQKYYTLEKIHYFTAPVRDNPSSLRRQEIYLKALESIPHLEIHMGKHVISGGKYSEKQTDVKIALQMYIDAINEDVDCIVLVSADSDQVPTIKKIIELNKGIEIRAIFPPSRKSDDLRKIIRICHKTKYKRLRAHQFPNSVSTDKFTVNKPKEWS